MFLPDDPSDTILEMISPADIDIVSNVVLSEWKTLHGLSSINSIQLTCFLSSSILGFLPRGELKPDDPLDTTLGVISPADRETDRCRIVTGWASELPSSAENRIIYRFI